VRKRVHLAGALIVGLVVSGMAPLAAAAPLTLADLQAGASFDSIDLSLTFSEFSITAGGSIVAPLSDFQVLVLDDGFEVVGPMSAFDGEIGSLDIGYRVTAVAELLEGLLSFDGAAAGAGSEAVVTETFGTLGAASVHSLEGDLQLFDSALLGGTVVDLLVSKQIDLVSVSQGGAVVGIVTQRFEVVPEPASLLLLLLGGLGTLALRRTR
jgi:hypothetical protein